MVVQDRTVGRVKLPLARVVMPAMLPLPLEVRVASLVVVLKVKVLFQVEDTVWGEVRARTTVQLVAPVTVTSVLNRSVHRVPSRSVAVQVPPGGVVVGGVVTGADVGDWLVGGVVLLRPKKAIAIAACPLNGRLCPTFATLIASTGAIVPVAPYRVRVQPDCGVSVETGVWLTPSTFVHCLISSPKFGYCKVVSAVPWNTCMRGRGPAYPGNALRTRSPHCCADMMRWPPEHWLFHIDPSVVAKQPNGTPMNAAPALNTSG